MGLKYKFFKINFNDQLPEYLKNLLMQVCDGVIFRKNVVKKNGRIMQKAVEVV